MQKHLNIRKIAFKEVIRGAVAGLTKKKQVCFVMMLWRLDKPENFKLYVHTKLRAVKQVCFVGVFLVIFYPLTKIKF